MQCDERRLEPELAESPELPCIIQLLVLPLACPAGEKHRHLAVFAKVRHVLFRRRCQSWKARRFA